MFGLGKLFGFGRQQKQPQEVFTPRAYQVNESMYIHRPDLEKALKEALQGTLHILVHGESGAGKSWLCKRVLRELNAVVVTANLASASRLGSINAELKNVIDREGQAHKKGFTEEKTATGTLPPVLESHIGHKGEYKIGEKEPVEACFDFARRRAGRNLACLVLDNLEAVFHNAAIMEQLANIITLLDDERYAKYRVKILIIGVPSEVARYFQQTPHLATVVNRLQEIPEVSRLSSDQTDDLIRRGFLTELNYHIDPAHLDTIIEHIRHITDRLPQRIHEYCLGLAYLGEEKRSIDPSLLPRADHNWLRNSLRADYAVIENSMNSREPRLGRRNQCLYALGKMSQDEFKWSDVELTIRQEFPSSTKDVQLNVSQILSDLLQNDPPILRRSPRGDAFMFKDPKYRMCIRVMLVKEDDESVSKKDIASLS